MDKYVYYANDNLGSSLSHAKKGEEVAGHKYIARKIGNTGKYIYTYNIKGNKNDIQKVDDELDDSSINGPDGYTYKKNSDGYYISDDGTSILYQGERFKDLYGYLNEKSSDSYIHVEFPESMKKYEDKWERYRLANEQAEQLRGDTNGLNKPIYNTFVDLFQKSAKHSDIEEDMNEDSNYLIHHGIKGQKWGVENGPPYPLSRNDYSALEKKMAGVQKQSDATNRQSLYTKQAYNSYGKRGSTELLNSKLEYQTRAQEHFYKSVNDARNYISKLKNSNLYSNNKDAQKIFKQYEKSIEQICKETSTLPKEFSDLARSRTAMVRKRNVWFGLPGQISAMARANNTLTNMLNDPKTLSEWEKYINS